MNRPLPTDPREIAGKLRSDIQSRLARVDPSEQLMGGFFGLAYEQPPLAEAVGINHPVFGSHYRLNDLGRAVQAECRAILLESRS